MFIRNVVGLGMAAAVALANNHPDYPFPEDIFWIVQHFNPLVTTRLDPVMNPGEFSNHVHAVVGGSNFGPTYDYDNLRQSKETTANLKNDFSNYWAPQLYHKNDNNTYSIGTLKFANTYYLMRRFEKEPVYEFPPGFRMLAGDPERRTLDVTDPAQDAVGFTCLGGDVTRRNDLPKEYCPQGMRAELHFPNCWDGVHSWLEGSKHVAYAEGKYDGFFRCPSSHPKRIMSLLYEFAFEDAPEYQDDHRVFANGDTTGYSFHADFTNGWPVGFFKTVFDYGRECSIQFNITECPPLDKQFIVRDPAAPYIYDGVQVVEDIGLQHKPIAKLPGNNPHADDYNETASFNSGTPANKAVASVLATDIRWHRVKGDPSWSLLPDDTPQTGSANSGSAQATSTGTSDYPAQSASSTVTSAQRASSQTNTAASATAASSVPGGGNVLVGTSTSSEGAYPSATGSASDSSSISFKPPVQKAVADASPSSMSSDAPPAEVIVPANGTAEVISSISTDVLLAPTSEATQPKGCGRKGRKGPHRSAM